MCGEYTWIYEHPDWPRFSWADADFVQPLSAARHAQGRLRGRMEALGFEHRTEARVGALVEDAVRSSAIEGEHLDPEAVRSSIGRKLGLDVGGVSATNRQVEGVVDMTLDAIENASLPLDAERLFSWHAALFPTGRSGLRRITVGDWRPQSADPIQVVSGRGRTEKVHFEAPGGNAVPGEMERFLHWYESPASLDPVQKAAVAHLWFLTIHPFEDGNGRIGRAIVDLTLSRSEPAELRPYSISAQIEAEKAAYYEQLEQQQRGDVDITEWMTWFTGCFHRAIERAETRVNAVMEKAAVWLRANAAGLNARQSKVLNRLLDDFEGKLTTSKYANMTRTSPDTALRDIQDMVAKGVLIATGEGGRSAGYLVDKTDAASPRAETHNQKATRAAI